MSTIKRVARKTPFVQIDKRALQDKRLSWKAKGLLAYLLSLPDDWKIYVDELKNHSTDGRDSTITAIKQLISNGYLKRSQKINENGHFEGYNYFVFEESLTDSAFSAFGKPVNGKPVNGKPATTNKDNTNNLNTDKVKKALVKKASSRFVKPTKDQLFDCFIEKLNKKSILGADTIAREESEKYYNYYESNGWKVGKSKMASWRHSVGGWIGRMKQYKTIKSKELNHDESIIDQESARAIIADVAANGF